MIKIENDKIYMTAGDACYVMGIREGKLYADHFGKRIELEDDVVALCGGGTPEFAPTVTAGGKKLEFEYAGASVLDVKPHRASALDGGKTLVVKFRAKNVLGVSAELYCTPYARGGFTKRAVVVNNSGGDIAVGVANSLRFAKNGKLLYVTGDGDIAKTDELDGTAPRSVDNFIAASADGGVYGFLSVYGDGLLTAKNSADGLRVDCAECDGVTVASGDSYMTPEVLAVFSDNGTGGMSRIFHDILREAPGGKFLKERRPIVLFCPPVPESKIQGAVKAAGELGVDVFALDIGVTSAKSLAVLVAECKEAGLKPGVKLDPFRISGKSAVFGKTCVKTESGYSCDLASDASIKELLELLEKAVKECGIEYLMIDLPRGGIQEFARGVYTVRHELRSAFGDELAVEWGIVSDKLRLGRLLCYPPCMMRTAVELGGGLKTAFDKASVGCLCYYIDPTALSDDVKRAVRAQIFSYQDDAPTVVYGDIYKLASTAGDVCIMSVTKDKSKAYVVCERKNKEKPARVKLAGLDEHNIYRVRELNKTFSGAALIYCGVPLLNADTVCLHIRQVADFE